MIGWVLAVFAFAAAFAVIAPAMTRHVSPALATRILVPGSIVVAVASTFARSEEHTSDSSHQHRSRMPSSA